MAELPLMAWAAREVVISVSWGGSKPDGLGEVVLERATEVSCSLRTLPSWPLGLPLE